MKTVRFVTSQTVL